MFYSDTIRTVGDIAAKKLAFVRKSPVGYLIAAMLAGAYVGVGAFLVFAIGGPFAAANSPWKGLMMGASFAVALSLVVFAGAELFTGNNMVMAIGWMRRRNSFAELLYIWGYSWLGNLLGCVALAGLLLVAGVLNNAPQYDLVQSVAAKKMHLPALTLFVRGILCNWLVCLGVWCAYRMKSEAAKLIMIFWCLYAFVASGFEHSVANMTLLSLALFQPHGPEITWLGFGHNMLWVSLGNAVGGAVLVGAAYWLAATEVKDELGAEVKTPATM